MRATKLCVYVCVCVCVCMCVCVHCSRAHCGKVKNAVLQVHHEPRHSLPCRCNPFPTINWSLSANFAASSFRTLPGMDVRWMLATTDTTLPFSCGGSRDSTASAGESNVVTRPKGAQDARRACGGLGGGAGVHLRKFRTSIADRMIVNRLFMASDCSSQRTMGRTLPHHPPATRHNR